MIESDVSSIRIFLVKFTLKIGQNKHLLLVVFWNLILGFIKLKIKTEKKIIGSFYEKQLLLSILLMSYYPEPDSHIRDKVKALLNLSNYVNKKELDITISC